VASVLKAYPALFFVIEYAGAAYLTYVGVTMAIGAIRRVRRRAVPDAPPVDAPVDASLDSSQTPAEPPVGHPFRRAFVISLLNPKAILFLISFFVQFLDPTYAYPALSFLVLAGILQVCSVLYLSALIFGGTFLASQFRRRRRLAAGLTAGVGAVFVGFGVRLATASLS
jgi:leucine efflux protein